MAKGTVNKGWIEINENNLPPSYLRVPVIHEGFFKIMSHENGWWYGLEKNESPKCWLNNTEVIEVMRNCTDFSQAGILRETNEVVA